MTQRCLGDILRERLARSPERKSGRRKLDDPDTRDTYLARVRFYEGLFLGLLFSVFTLVYAFARCS